MTKEELRSYRYICKQICQLEMERKHWYSVAGRCTRAPSRAPVFGHSDPYPRIMDKLTVLDERLKRKYDVLIDKRLRIEEAIELLDEREQWLIRARYVERWEWGQIAKEMHYSLRQVHYTHGAALKRLHSIAHPDML